MLNRPALALALMLGAAVGGCTTAPTVSFHQLGVGPRSDGAVPFQLTDSTIVLGAAATPADAVKDGAVVIPITLSDTVVQCVPNVGCSAPGLAVIVGAIDDSSAVYALEPRTRGLVSTSVAPSYVPNSLRLRELAIAVKDHRLEVINTIGAIAIGARKLGLGGGGDDEDQKATVPGASTTPQPLPVPLSLPVIIDLAAAKAVDSDGHCRDGAGLACHALPHNPGWSYRLRFIDDAAKLGFLPRSGMMSVRGAMVASVCRRVQLDLDYAAPGGAPVAMAAMHTMVADPDWLITVPMPAKGQLVFHPLCGMDMKREEVTTVGADEMARAFNSNIDALRSAHP